jgi:hypothetical protein
VTSEDVKDAKEEVESSSNEDSDEDGEDNLQAEIDDLNEYAGENSEKSLEINFRDLRFSLISSEAAEESSRQYEVDTLSLHLKLRQEGTELKSSIQKIIQLLQDALKALCSERHMILCRNHEP